MHLTIDEMLWRNIGHRRSGMTKYLYNKIIYEGLSKSEYFDYEKMEERYMKSRKKRKIVARMVRRKYSKNESLFC